MAIEIGGCSFSFGPKSLDQALRIVKDLGFDIADVGVCPGNGQLDPVSVALAPESHAAEALRALDEESLRPDECFVLDFGTSINHPEPQVRQKNRRLFRGLIHFASLVNFRSIMLLPGINHAAIGKERSFDIAVEELGEFVKMSQDAEIQLNVEPCEPSVAQDPRDAGLLCDRVSGLGLTLDYSHFVDPGYSQAAVEPLHRFAKHFHARQAAPGKRVEAVKKGSIDFNRMVARLKREHYSGVVAVEYVDCDVTRLCGVSVLTETINMRAELLHLLEKAAPST